MRWTLLVGTGALAVLVAGHADGQTVSSRVKLDTVPGPSADSALSRISPELMAGLRAQLAAAGTDTVGMSPEALFRAANLMLDQSIFYLNANVAFILTDYLYAAAGFTLNASDSRLERKTTVEFKYLR